MNNECKVARLRSKAFTLVELLVVIGIIALLISILLPSLNRARQQANLIKCAANLHSIGQALAIYESENKNLMPMGLFQRTPNPGNQETQWYWTFELGQILNRNMMNSGGYVTNLSKAFQDADTFDGPSRRYIQHYTCNPRLMYSAFEYTFGDDTNPLDVFNKPMSHGRKTTDIKNTSQTFAIWDGAQASAPADSPLNGGLDYNVHEVAEGIDAYGFYYTGLCFPNSDINGIKVKTELAVWPTSVGDPGTSNGQAAQAKYNIDVDQYNGNGNNKTTPWVSLRFRHVKNTTLNALCVDGHVEPRRVGTVTRRDIYANVPS